MYQTCCEEHKKTFSDLKLVGIPYFSLKPIPIRRNFLEKNYTWTWNYSKTEKSAYHQFIDEWVTILEIKYRLPENQDKIIFLIENYMKQKKKLIKILNDCVRESNNMIIKNRV